MREAEIDATGTARLRSDDLEALVSVLRTIRLRTELPAGLDPDPVSPYPPGYASTARLDLTRDYDGAAGLERLTALGFNAPGVPTLPIPGFIPVVPPVPEPLAAQVLGTSLFAITLGTAPYSQPTLVAGFPLFGYATGNSGRFELEALGDRQWQAGPATIELSFCRDSGWRGPRTRSPGLTLTDERPYERLTDCGAVGWTAGANGPVLRIPFRVRIAGLSITTKFRCPQRRAEVEMGMTPQALALCNQIFDAPVIGACAPGLELSAGLNGTTSSALLPDGTIDPSASAPVEFALHIDLSPQRCSVDGADATLPRCPVFPQELTADRRPVRPGVMLVPSVSTGPVYRDGVGQAVLNLRPRFTQPGCGLTQGLTNGVLDIMRRTGDLARVESGILQQVVNNLVPAQLAALTSAAFPVTAPGQPGAQIAATTTACPTDATGQPDVACTTNQLAYAISRTVYRYLTGPFNGPGGNATGGPRYTWESLSLDPPASLTRRSDLLVRVAQRAMRSTRTCPSGRPLLNPTASEGFDTDGDRVPDQCDNCPTVPNAAQCNCNALSEMQLAQPVLGDACDPNPCAEIVSVGVTARRGTTRDPAPVRMRPVQAPRGAALANEGDVRVNPLALRRCVCQEATTGEPQTMTRCQSTNCVQAGEVGQATNNVSWNVVDWSTPSEQCTRSFAGGLAVPYRCLPRPIEGYYPEVVRERLALGRMGTEALNDRPVTYDWSWSDEYARGALTQSRTAVNDVRTYLWTRAAAEVDTFTPTRLRDNYRQTPDVLEVAFTHGPPSLNYCAIEPARCGLVRFIPRLRTIFDPIPVRNSWALQSGLRALGVVPVGPNDVNVAPNFGAGGGDLSPNFVALGVGFYEPRSGLWTALGGSVGTLPPVSGTAFAFATGNDGKPRVFAVGGDTPNGPAPFFYEGAVELAQASVRTTWQRRALQAPPQQPGPQFIAFDSATGPAARTHASLVASPDGRALYLFGGRGLQGQLADLWRYDLASETWLRLDVPQSVGPRSDATIATDGDLLVVFGGRGAQNELLSDAFILLPESGITEHLQTGLTPRAEARGFVEAGTLLLYGGVTAAGVTDQLAELSLDSGAVLRSRVTGFASAGTAAVARDVDGTLYVVPSGVAGSSIDGGALVGTFDGLAMVPQRTTLAGLTSCGSDQAPALPCQAVNAWTSAPGTFVCGVTPRVCAGGASATPSTVTPAIEATSLASDGRSFVVADGRTVRVFAPGAPPTLLQTIDAGDTVRSVALTPTSVLVGTRVGLASVPRVEGAAMAPSSIETCGEVRRVFTAGSDLLVDSTLGLEWFGVRDGVLQRPRVYVLSRALEDMRFRGLVDTVDAGIVTACRVLRGSLLGRLGALAPARSVERTSDGVLWVSQGNVVLAARLDPERGLRVLDHERIGVRAAQVRAIDGVLTVVGATLLDRPVLETLRWVPESDANPWQGQAQSLGAHAASAWVTQRPQRVGDWVVRLNGRATELARVAR